MSWILRAELIVLALVAIVVVIHAVNRRVLQLKYSLIWLLISLCLVAAALFPKIAFAVTALVGIETPSNLDLFPGHHRAAGHLLLPDGDCLPPGGPHKAADTDSIHRAQRIERQRGGRGCCNRKGQQVKWY